MSAKLIDVALLKKFDDAIGIYINDSAMIDTDKTAIIALLTNYLSRMKDINFLLQNKRANSANVLMRVAFETYVYLKYIFEKYNRMSTRANAYYYHNFQKLSDMLNHIDQTNISTSKDMIDDINNHPRALGHYQNLNDYFNDKRERFRTCFNINNKSLNFTKLSTNDTFHSCPIDQWKWYNDNGKTSSFLKLVIRLGLLDEYAALYSPTSNNIHSDSLQNQLKMSPHSLTIFESYDPNMLVCFRASIIEFLPILKKITVDNDKKRQIERLYNSACFIYRTNYGHNKQQ